MTTKGQIRAMFDIYRTNCRFKPVSEQIPNIQYTVFSKFS